MANKTRNHRSILLSTFNVAIPRKTEKDTTSPALRVQIKTSKSTLEAISHLTLPLRNHSSRLNKVRLRINTKSISVHKKEAIIIMETDQQLSEITRIFWSVPISDMLFMRIVHTNSVPTKHKPLMIKAFIPALRGRRLIREEYKC